MNFMPAGLGPRFTKEGLLLKALLSVLLLPPDKIYVLFLFLLVAPIDFLLLIKFVIC